MKKDPKEENMFSFSSPALSDTNNNCTRENRCSDRLRKGIPPSKTTKSWDAHTFLLNFFLLRSSEGPKHQKRNKKLPHQQKCLGEIRREGKIKGEKDKKMLSLISGRPFLFLSFSLSCTLKRCGGLNGKKKKITVRTVNERDCSKKERNCGFLCHFFCR